MNTYVVTEKTHDQLVDATNLLAKSVDCATETGAIIAGAMVHSTLPWDASPNWELRHTPPTEALLIDGLPVLQQREDVVPVDVVHLVALMTGMRRGMPWAWEQQSTLFGTLRSPEQYAEIENIAIQDLSTPRVADSMLLELAPGTVALSATTLGVRVGWVSSTTLAERMPADLRKAATANWFRRDGNSMAAPLISYSDDMQQPPRLVLGTGKVAAIEGAPSVAVGALEYLRAVASERMTWTDLKPGQVIVVPNRFGQHAIELGEDTAVRRVHWSRDLRAHRLRLSTARPMFFARPSSAA